MIEPLRHIYICALLSLACFALNVWAQTSCVSRPIIVNARDHKDQFVSSLQASNFKVKLNGKPVEVSSAVSTTGVHRMVLVIDASGSMASSRALINASTLEILRSFPNETQFGLVIFSNSVLRTISFGHPRQEIMNAVAGIEFKGPTGLRDALQSANGFLNPSQVGDVVILLSDGGDNASQKSDRELRQAYLSSEVRVIALLITRHYFATAEEREDLNDLRALADGTGGQVLDITGANDVAKIRDLADKVERYYLISIPGTASGKPSSLQLDMVDSNGKKQRGVQLDFPKQVPSCPPVN